MARRRKHITAALMMLTKPCSPPAKGAVGDNEMLALAHQPQVGIGHGVALIVVHQRYRSSGRGIRARAAAGLSENMK